MKIFESVLWNKVDELIPIWIRLRLIQFRATVYPTLANLQIFVTYVPRLTVNHITFIWRLSLAQTYSKPHIIKTIWVDKNDKTLEINPHHQMMEAENYFVCGKVHVFFSGNIGGFNCDGLREISAYNQFWSIF